jgi:hypothetical protein
VKHKIRRLTLGKKVTLGGKVVRQVRRLWKLIASWLKT